MEVTKLMITSIKKSSGSNGKIISPEKLGKNWTGEIKGLSNQQLELKGREGSNWSKIQREENDRKYEHSHKEMGFGGVEEDQEIYEYKDEEEDNEEEKDNNDYGDGYKFNDDDDEDNNNDDDVDDYENGELTDDEVKEKEGRIEILGIQKQFEKGGEHKIKKRAGSMNTTFLNIQGYNSHQDECPTTSNKSNETESHQSLKLLKMMQQIKSLSEQELNTSMRDPVKIAQVGGATKKKLFHLIKFVSSEYDLTRLDDPNSVGNIVMNMLNIEENETQRIMFWEIYKNVFKVALDRQRSACMTAIKNVVVGKMTKYYDYLLKNGSSHFVPKSINETTDYAPAQRHIGRKKTSSFKLSSG